MVSCPVAEISSPIGVRIGKILCAKLVFRTPKDHIVGVAD